MKTKFPSAQEYSSEAPRHPALAVIDVHSEQTAVTDAYRNQVLVDVNGDCMRLAVFEGEYRWHYHPDSDELFLVQAGKLQIELSGGDHLELTEWQCAVIPAGTVHRTRGIGRTVNVTFEKRGAQTVFVDSAT